MSSVRYNQYPTIFLKGILLLLAMLAWQGCNSGNPQSNSKTNPATSDVNPNIYIPPQPSISELESNVEFTDPSKVNRPLRAWFGYAFATENDVRVRPYPAVTDNVIGLVGPNQRGKVVKRTVEPYILHDLSDYWYLIEFSKDLQGFIFGSQLRFEMTDWNKQILEQSIQLLHQAVGTRDPAMMMEICSVHGITIEDTHFSYNRFKTVLNNRETINISLKCHQSNTKETTLDSYLFDRLFRYIYAPVTSPNATTSTAVNPIPENSGNPVRPTPAATKEEDPLEAAEGESYESVQNPFEKSYLYTQNAMNFYKYVNQNPWNHFNGRNYDAIKKELDLLESPYIIYLAKDGVRFYPSDVNQVVFKMEFEKERFVLTEVSEFTFCD